MHDKIIKKGKIKIKNLLLEKQIFFSIYCKRNLAPRSIYCHDMIKKSHHDDLHEMIYTFTQTKKTLLFKYNDHKLE